MPPSKHKLKLDQKALDANLVTPLLAGHSHLLAKNLVHCTDTDRDLYEQRCFAELKRMRHGLIRNVHTRKIHAKVRGGMSGSFTVYALNVTSVHIALADSLAVSRGAPEAAEHHE